MLNRREGKIEFLLSFLCAFAIVCCCCCRCFLFCCRCFSLFLFPSSVLQCNLIFFFLPYSTKFVFAVDDQWTIQITFGWKSFTEDPSGDDSLGIGLMPCQPHRVTSNRSLLSFIKRTHTSTLPIRNKHTLMSNLEEIYQSLKHKYNTQTHTHTHTHSEHRFPAPSSKEGCRKPVLGVSHTHIKHKLSRSLNTHSLKIKP